MRQAGCLLSLAGIARMQVFSQRTAIVAFRSAKGRALSRSERRLCGSPNFAKESALPPGLDIDAKERIRQAVSIVDLVSATQGDVRRQGANFVCRCPWHDD